LLLIPFQAAFEEVLFRGYLMQGLAVLARNRWIPVLSTSILFGLMHGLNPEVMQYGFLTMMPQYIFFGIVFAVLTMFDDGIELAIGAHAANNIFLSVLVTHEDMALQTPALYEQIQIYPWKEFGGLVLQSLIFLAIMALVFKWKEIRRLYARINAPAAEVSDAVDAG
jgi:membrane protease YdiL (CAAX protease family)